MGMFDYVHCEYPLPGNPPANASEIPFQTKDLDCWLENYVIGVDGQLRQETYRVEDRSDPKTEGIMAVGRAMTRISEGWKDLDFTGVVELDWSNIVASGPGSYTANGEDAHYLEYRITFVRGKVESIEEVNNHTEPSMKSSAIWPTFKKLSDEELDEIKRTENASYLGRTLFVWWGGRNECYPVRIVAENTKELVAENEDGKFEVLGRWQFGSTLFLTPEDGIAANARRKHEWERQKQVYEEEIARKKKERES